MAKNYGKQFEDKFKADFSKIEGSSVDRLYDTMNGYKAITQISDFIAYAYPNIFYIECKSHRGASIPMKNLRQYEKLCSKVGIKGVRTGIVLWLIDKDLVLYIPTSTITQMKADGEKSVGIRHLDKYNIKVIPSKKKRVFMDSDYSILLELNEGE